MVSELANYDFQLIIQKIKYWIQHGEPKGKSGLTWMKFATQGSSRSLIMNPNLKLRILECIIYVIIIDSP